MGGGSELGGRLGRKGRDGYLCPIHAVVQQKSAQHCKAITLELKVNKNSSVLEERPGARGIVSLP